jgi:class 3 adenylate cyclase
MDDVVAVMDTAGSERATVFAQLEGGAMAALRALAGPGEVLVSGTVRDLVVGSGISFEDRGERELKGVPGLWRLWAAAT